MGLIVLETFVVGEERTISPSVAEPSVEIEMALERLTLDACGFCPRTFFFGVDGVEREFRFGAVLDL